MAWLQSSLAFLVERCSFYRRMKLFLDMIQLVVQFRRHRASNEFDKTFKNDSWVSICEEIEVNEQADKLEKLEHDKLSRNGNWKCGLINIYSNTELTYQDKIQRPLFTLPLPALVLNALAMSGFNSCEDLFFKNKGSDSKGEDISANNTFISDNIEEWTRNLSVNSVYDLLKDGKTNFLVPSIFTNVMDQKLKELFSLGDIVHICGSPGSGKTQLVLQLCVCVQIPKCLNGLECEAIFIDTDSGFSPTKLSVIAEAVVDECKNLVQCQGISGNVKDFTAENVLEKIHYIQVSSYHELLAAVHSLHSFLTNHPMVKLIVIDSLAFPFIGMTNTLERTRLVLMIINKLYCLARILNLTVVVTNHMITRITGQTSHTLPSLGESFSHSIPHTICLDKIGNRFQATVLKSNKLPNSEIIQM